MGTRDTERITRKIVGAGDSLRPILKAAFWVTLLALLFGISLAKCVGGL